MGTGEAYGSVLGGAFGLVSGNNPIGFFSGPGLFWTMLSWPDVLDSAGSRSMTIFGDLFQSLDWWKLVPDQTILRNGEENGERRKVAVRAEDQSAAYVFYPANEGAAIRLSVLGAAANYPAFWFDPRDGQTESIGVLTEAKALNLRPPAGWEDALLVIERAAK